MAYDWVWSQFVRGLTEGRSCIVHIEGTLEPELMFELAAPQRCASAVRFGG